ncbi:sel1 repeat family protein [Methylobacterium sp. 77]|uniref:tetratricopeptide repeat protein n=1 Tax=Methylobacterium sp. 77 TaxID=1101192 RepID=UPI001FD91086|nr:sel1 repeat family protein [Methylobacterium sp. 77]
MRPIDFRCLALFCFFGGLCPVVAEAGKMRSAPQETAIDRCDSAAAAPWDPDSSNVPSRVEFRDLQAQQAIEACRRAVDLSPDMRRLSFQLGRAYDRQGANPDAYRAYRVAAELGSAAAKVNIGILYRQGRRFEKNEVKARTWFRDAAEMGLAEGMYCYATALDNGVGGPADGVAARTWYVKAAERGTSKARDALVRLDIDGLGTGTRCD